ncbi:hypothetical protein FB45DRAFT_542454 [Roridomyces roridus]|uniref:Uncharacterized protein n=1 Tax=Roridomyces roridus TaxID=1738132 RepID=A0AAD7FL37_9AGAR|nr:hypothetical protein FB45DRAFT_542454 [Roridomyces roridus]
MPVLSLPFNVHHSRDRPLYAVGEPCPIRVELPSDALIRLPSRADRTSGFFRALCQRYRPAPPVERLLPCENTPVSPAFPVNWTRPKHSPQSRKAAKPLPDKLSGGVLQKAIYVPHGKWAWAAGLSFRQSQPGILLSSGVMCSAFLKTGMIGDRSVQYVSKVWATKEKWHGFFSELALYKVQLKSLQGRIVPAIINVYSSAGAVSVAMEPPHHSFWIEASADMPHVLKKRCVQAFEKLHACGVYHGDIELRHMLIGGDARVTIIDFQASRALVPNEAVHLAAATPDELRMEMRKVRFKLDYEGARAWEDQKLMRAARLEKRNRENGTKEEPLEEDILDPPIDSREWNLEWVGAPVEPARFVMPGQSAEALERSVDEFISIVETLESEEQAREDNDVPRRRKQSPEFKPPAAIPRRAGAAPAVGMGFGGMMVRPGTTGSLKRKGDGEQVAQTSPKRPRTDAPQTPPDATTKSLHPSPAKRKRASDLDDDSTSRGRPKMRTSCTDTPMDVCDTLPPPCPRMEPILPRSKTTAFVPPPLFRWMDNLWRFVY